VQAERGANGTRVRAPASSGQSLSDLEVIYAVAPEQGPERSISSSPPALASATAAWLVSIGDGGNPPAATREVADPPPGPNRSSALGQALRNHPGMARSPWQSLCTRRRAPESGATDTAMCRVWAWTPLNGRVWVRKHGARGGDELNLVEAGANYRLPVVTHSREYSGPPILWRLQSARRMVDPRGSWTPAIAHPGLAIDRGDPVSRLEWQNLFAGGLVSAMCAGSSLQADGTGGV